MTILISSNDRAQAMYEKIIDDTCPGRADISFVIVQHIVPNTIPFLKAIRSRFHMSALIPKPRSIHASALDQLENSSPRYPILHARRDQLLDREYVKANIVDRAGDRRVVVLDIGGYFSDSLPLLHELMGEQMIGVVEDTENGHQKYQAVIEIARRKQLEVAYPIFSVARSPLKEPEDFLVGQSVLYGLERALRDNNTLLTNKIVLVIGYGKIGKSIAGSLAVRNVTVWIYDQDPIRSAQALAHGFHIPDRGFGIQNADVLIGATGSKSLEADDFLALKPYSFVCSVTSADDEFNFGSLRQRTTSREIGSDEVFYNGTKLFHLLNKGNALNFQYNNSLGTYIYLVGCELLGCAMRLIREIGATRNDKITTLTTPERQALASAWMREFRNNEVHY